MYQTSKPEIWGQIHEKENEIARYANLGIKRVRYQFSWNSIAPNQESEFWKGSAWRAFDHAVIALNQFSLTPVVGLLHPGKTPSYTSLIDPEFPEKLARYALAFARRYPHLTDYTPVNEPISNAKRNGLPKHLYGKNHRVFLRSLFHQIRGTSLAMKEIRKYNPGARLIQTEELGKIHSTPLLQYQADFENRKRWLSFDLLSGHVTEHHPLWSFFLKNGIGEAELRSLLEAPCPPDVIGIHHIPESNRYLDERLELYSPDLRGGNEKHLYADAGTIHARPELNPLFSEILEETWIRYKTPIALTDISIQDSRENQLEWVKQLLNSAQIAKKAGVQIEAITHLAASKQSESQTSYLSAGDGFGVA